MSRYLYERELVRRAKKHLDKNPYLTINGVALMGRGKNESLLLIRDLAEALANHLAVPARTSTSGGGK